MIDQDQLNDALGDALAICEELAGLGLQQKLAAFGLDAEDVKRVLDVRYRAHVAAGGAPVDFASFVQGWVEGLMTGAQLARRA